MRILAIAFCLFITNFILSQSKNYTVLLNADVQKSPAQIKLKWNFQSGVTSYQVFRKLKSENTWGTARATLSANDTTYIDNTISPNIIYEYMVAKNAGSYYGYGFICSGIECDLSGNKGKAIILIDSNIYDSIKSELTTWENDVNNEGWQSAKISVPRGMSSENVKLKLLSEYQKDPTNTKAVFIIGHVTVPYAGNFKPYPPDGHTEHVVAWPADVFYSDIDGSWTDEYVDDTTGAQARHKNIPFDGKWDQTTLDPNNTADLQVGRVDFFNMPAFAKSEIQLLKDYLVKCHNYKTGLNKPNRRGLIDDNFGGFSGEAFAASGWGNLAPLIGKDNIVFCDTVNKADYIGTMDTASYLWSYGCGAGGYSSCSGIGNSSNLASKNIKTTFTMLFGSYFGDWDSPNNFLRAALASGTTLTNVWSGRPRWFFHHMGMGENIGYSTVLTQNTINGSPLYNGTTAPNMIHIALMGDPTLKLHYPVSPTSLNAVLKDSIHTQLTWSHSGETVAGFHMYKRRKNEAIWTKINKSIIPTTSFIDSCISSPDTFIYQVRAVKLETTPTGSYFNESLGSTFIFNNAINLKPTALFSVTNSDPTFSFSNTSLKSKSTIWSYSDTSMTSVSTDHSRTYSKNGDYWVLLTSSNYCTTDTQKIYIKVTKAKSSISNSNLENILSIYPNPTKHILNIESLENGRIQIYSIDGKVLSQFNIIKNQSQTFSISHYPRGVYLLNFIDDKGIESQWKIDKE